MYMEIATVLGVAMAKLDTVHQIDRKGTSAVDSIPSRCGYMRGMHLHVKSPKSDSGMD